MDFPHLDYFTLLRTNLGGIIYRHNVSIVTHFPQSENLREIKFCQACVTNGAHRRGAVHLWLMLDKKKLRLGEALLQ